MLGVSQLGGLFSAEPAPRLLQARLEALAATCWHGPAGIGSLR